MKNNLKNKMMIPQNVMMVIKMEMIRKMNEN